MKLVCAFLIFSTLLISCVPIKKYEELQAKEKQCSDELAKYKNNALDYEASFKDVKTENRTLLFVERHTTSPSQACKKVPSSTYSSACRLGSRESLTFDRCRGAFVTEVPGAPAPRS